MAELITKRKSKHFPASGADLVDALYDPGNSPQYLYRFTIKNLGDSDILFLVQNATPVGGDFNASTCTYSLSAGETYFEESIDGQSGNNGRFDLADWYFKVPDGGHLLLTWVEYE